MTAAKRRRRFLLAVLPALLLPGLVVLPDSMLSGLPANTCRAETTEKTFLAGLRSRRLFALAERYCRQRLENEQLAPREQADLTVEWIRVRAEQAVHARGEEREAAWDAARQVAADFLRRHAEHPRAVLVQVQDALTLLARGELARQEAELAADPAPLVEAARAHLREAVRLLEAIDKQLVQAIAWKAGNRGDETGMTSVELFSLQHHVQYQLGRAHRNRAQLYPAGSENALATLTAATEHLARPLAQLTPEDSLWWSIRLEQITCHRLLKEYAQADRLLRELLAAGPPNDARWAALAEAARLRIAVDQAEEALQLIERSDPSDGARPADVDLARLECLLALGEAADRRGDAERAKEWQQRAVNQVEAMERQHGPFWGRRAELLLVRRGGGGSANLEVLERTAANFYRKGQLDEAIDAYDQAAARATEGGLAEAAFGLGYKAALIEQQRKRHEEAGRRLREVALGWPRAPDAGKAHLLAAWNLAQVAREQPQRVDDYRQVLEEHLASWPGQPTAGQAAQWLASLHEAAGRWPEATAAYAQTPAGTPHSLQGLEAAARCWKRWLRQIDASGQPVEPEALRAAAWLEGWVLGTEGRLPERWSEAARVAALEAAQLRLEYQREGHARAEQLLRAGLDGAPAPNDEWKALADGLLIVAIAGQPGRGSEARALAAQLEGSSPERLLEVLGGLSRLMAEGSSRGAREIARLQLALIDRLQASPQPLKEDARRQIADLQAGALLAAGDPATAGERLKRLAQEHPRRASVQRAYGRSLLESDRREAWREAVDQWRKIGAGAAKHSELWWEAKYSVADALRKLGEKEQAAQRIEYLLATEKVESAEWKRRFEALLARCRGGERTGASR